MDGLKCQGDPGVCKCNACKLYVVLEGLGEQLDVLCSEAACAVESNSELLPGIQQHIRTINDAITGIKTTVSPSS